MSKQYPGGLITKSPVVPSGPYSNDTASGIWTLDQQAYWAKLGQWPNANNPPIDPQFNYVTMLLHGDGTNGAQNNTFLDSSTNNFTITRNGNTTQGSFSPYGSNWSNAFDGSSALTVPDSTAFTMGSGNFTVELWFNATSTPSQKCLIGQGNLSTPSSCSFFLDIATTTPRFFVLSGSTEYNISSSTDITAGVWYHLAGVRNGNTLYLYLNGVQVGTRSVTGVTINDSTTVLGIGRIGTTSGNDFNGYISNVRIVKGTAVYTSAFTPSTTPLTAITNTQLLTCQSNRFIDNSSNAFAITVAGAPSVQRFNPFGASTAYSTSVIGGSGYFDGSDSLSGPTNETAFQFGTGDFTVEAWVYHTADDGYPTILEIGNHLTTTGILFIKFGPSGGNVAAIYSGGFKGSTPVTMNAWNHIAYVRSSGSLKIYVNGVSPAGVAFTNNLTNSNKITIGTDQNLTAGYYFAGNISNLRVVKSTAVYTADFTPPTAPLTAISGTSLLMPMINAGIFDNAMMNDLETVGNAQISTSVVKFGTGSMLFDGTGDYLAALNTPSSTPSGTGSWTIEGWIYKTATNAFKAIYINGYPIQIFLDTDTIEVYIARSNSPDYIVNGLTGPASSIVLNTWAHFAVVRNGDVYTVYVNGVGGSTTTSADAIAFPSNANATIGDAPIFGAYGYTGYIDDFRITKGYARYTANFTPPTSAFSNFGPNT